MDKRQQALENIEHVLTTQCYFCTLRSPTHFAQTDRFCRKECEYGQKLQEYGKILDSTIKDIRKERQNAKLHDQTRRQTEFDGVVEEGSKTSERSDRYVRGTDGGDMRLWLG